MPLNPPISPTLSENGSTSSSDISELADVQQPADFAGISSNSSNSSSLTSSTSSSPFSETSTTSSSSESSEIRDPTFRSNAAIPGSSDRFLRSFRVPLSAGTYGLYRDGNSSYYSENAERTFLINANYTGNSCLGNQSVFLLMNGDEG